FDHDTDHAAGGKTSTSNGSAKHRRHHNLKTRRLWHTRQHPDGTITWTTLLGRRYDTEPHDYHELHDPQDPHQEPTTTPPPTPEQEEPPF
ncbi:MAG TPA: HNH endonuclease, partial [Segeticoccus sp.]|nr:HNH endonuclease [Segeticoccus sp.]